MRVASGSNHQLNSAAGVLLPGDAFVVEAQKTMDPVHRVKLRLAVWF